MNDLVAGDSRRRSTPDDPRCRIAVSGHGHDRVFTICLGCLDDGHREGVVEKFRSGRARLRPGDDPASPRH